MAATRGEVLRLYKKMLRESISFSNYSYRTYALRRIKDAFRENKGESDPGKIKDLIMYGVHNLEIIKRQVVISQLYKTPELIVEACKKQSNDQKT
ncbi:LYR motif-containing protein 4-like [Limulus polyphemus]|uniref:LYR motif-containing protein 4-like n=1 Tax=Limulus polyphemus TaxID=6850 RepID=A0ABM1B0J8_LIMPO|nr:LYR motif-containing protein 4-like [Limulus polyphemus]